VIVTDDGPPLTPPTVMFKAVPSDHTNGVAWPGTIDPQFCQKLPAGFKPHGTPATDHFWSLFWTIPADFPTGSLGYKVIATMNDGSTVEWVPFIRPTTQLMVVAGDPTPAAPK
jgi:hypothetical protein